ncbi:hypothetical protein HA402_005617 [Bradysia odoriphaga]|nr:hypothetical protein HA402_005617 [Bradysia odoriphaga]
MIPLIWVLITFVTNYSCYAATTKVIENVYIDTLVQRYLTEEKLTWTEMYANYSSDQRRGNVNFIRNKIRTFDIDIVEDPHLEYTTSADYMSQFIDYMDFYNIQNYVEDYLNKEQNPYRTFEMTYHVYNHTRLDQLFDEILENTNSTCSAWSTEMGSTSHTIFMFYEILSANLLVSYMNSQRFNMIKVIDKGLDQEHDHEIFRTKFTEMYNRITKAALDSLERASRIVWMCDSNEENVGDSLEITNFLRGYIDNEINLNNEQSCWGTCSDYRFARNYGCYNNTFCDVQRKVGEADPVCRGTIVDCLFIEDKLEVCPSMITRNRRYEYINYGCTPHDRMNQSRCLTEGRYFGQSGKCETKPKTLQTFRNEWFMSCNYCFCYCDEQGIDSDRYFSLREVVSDVRDNMIISGISIVKRNGIFSFTISQSKLVSRGRVERLNPGVNVIFSDFSRSDAGIVEGVDYHTLSWQNRSVNLDTIILPRGSVVTGVRFVVEREHIGLQIRGTKFDFISGTLFDANEWVGKEVWDRKNVHINRPEPNRYHDVYGAYLSEADFRPNLFVKFRPSDPDKDAGQSTVPFIDSQWVRPKILTPLSGIGLYYKGKPGMGGFIAPAIVVYDNAPHIGNKLSP